MSEVKLCPFCGKKPECVEIYVHSGLHEGGWSFVVRCNALKGGCGASGGGRVTEEEAIKAWNMRVEKEEL